MRRLVAILTAATALLGTAATSEAVRCRELSGAWTAYLAMGKTTGNFHVIDSIIKLWCFTLPPAVDTLCVWDHRYQVSYQWQPGSNVWPIIPTPKANHPHGVLCKQSASVILERSQLGAICGGRPNTPIEVVDYLWDGPAPSVGPVAGGPPPVAVRIKRWRFRCPPLIVGPGPVTPDGVAEENPEP